MKNTRKFTAEDLQNRLAANKSLRKANPKLFQGTITAYSSPAIIPLGAKEGKDGGKRPKRGKKRREMNRTEHEFSLYLDTLVDHGMLVSWDYEGLTLRWGQDAGMMTYTPDFVAVRDLIKLNPEYLKAIGREDKGIMPYVQLVFFEIKGAFAWQKDIVKFKAARANWELYDFQLWEKGADGWQKTI